MSEVDKKNDIGELIAAETTERLKIMGKPGYEFPEKLNKADYAAMIGIAGVSLVLIVLCMTGVII